jgi:hypothetical protein
LTGNHDEQVEIYYADKDNLQITARGYEPRWIKLPQPHTLCPSTPEAHATIHALKKTNIQYSLKIFRFVRVRDNEETYNEWTNN